MFAWPKSCNRSPVLRLGTIGLGHAGAGFKPALYHGGPIVSGGILVNVYVSPEVFATFYFLADAAQLLTSSS